MNSRALVLQNAESDPQSTSLTAPRSALLQKVELDSLPYFDGAPSAEHWSEAQALITAAAAQLPRQPSAYLDADNTSVSPPRTPTLADQIPTMPTPRSALEAATATACSAAVSTGRGELGVRFGPAAWRERCTIADIAQAAATRDRGAAELELSNINRRRSSAQQAIGKRVSKLQKEYYDMAGQNRELADEISRLREERRR